MPLKTYLEDEPQINLTALIDVVFQLVLFFMVCTTFAQMEHRVDLQVPTVRESGPMTPPPSRRVVSVLRDGGILLDNQPVSLGELTQRLTVARQEYSELGVIVRGDGSGAFQHVAEALNACKLAGIQDLGITVRVARAPK